VIYHVAVKMSDGSTRMEDVIFPAETSHFRLQQKVLADIPGATSCQIFEDKWKKGSKTCMPTDRSRAVAYMKCASPSEDEYTPVLLLFGWTSEDVKPIAGGGFFWTYIEVPSLPPQLEGNG